MKKAKKKEHELAAKKHGWKKKAEAEKKESKQKPLAGKNGAKYKKEKKKRERPQGRAQDDVGCEV